MIARHIAHQRMLLVAMATESESSAPERHSGLNNPRTKGKQGAGGAKINTMCYLKMRIETNGYHRSLTYNTD